MSLTDALVGVVRDVLGDEWTVRAEPPHGTHRQVRADHPLCEAGLIFAVSPEIIADPLDWVWRAASESAEVLHINGRPQLEHEPLVKVLRSYFRHYLIGVNARDALLSRLVGAGLLTEAEAEWLRTDPRRLP